MLNNNPLEAEHLYLEVERQLLREDESSSSHINNSSILPENFYIRLSRIRFAIKESIMMNLSYIFISLGKISIVSLFLFVNDEEKCSGSLKVWFTTMFSYDILNVMTTTLMICEIMGANHRLQETLDNSFDNSFRNFDLTFHSQVRRRMGNENSLNGFDVNNNIERHNPWTSYLLEFCRFCYLLLFLFGNVIFFSETVCSKENSPWFWTTSLIFIIMGYIYYLIPLVLFVLTCLYLPFGLFIMYCFPEERISQRQNFIDSLSTKKIKESFLKKSPKEVCCICMMEYEENHDIIVLPCNENHFFHETCIKSWLSRNGVCPICRNKFAESFSDAH